MKKKLSKAIASRLKELRELAGLSQQEVATSAGLSLSLVARLEQGKKADPRTSTLLALSGALKVSPGRVLDDLFPISPAKEAAAEPVSGANGQADIAPAEETKKKKGKKKKSKKEETKAKSKTEAGESHA